MGYYTDFTMNYDEAVLEKLKNYADDLDIWQLKEFCDNDGYINTKWYDMKDDMASFAKENPTVSFVVEARGEEADDLWCLKVENGKVFLAEGYIAYKEATEYVPSPKEAS